MKDARQIAEKLVVDHTFENNSLNDADVVMDIGEFTSAITTALEDWGRAEYLRGIEDAIQVCHQHHTDLSLLGGKPSSLTTTLRIRENIRALAHEKEGV